MRHWTCLLHLFRVSLNPLRLRVCTGISKHKVRHERAHGFVIGLDPNMRCSGAHRQLRRAVGGNGSAGSRGLITFGVGVDQPRIRGRSRAGKQHKQGEGIQHGPVKWDAGWLSQDLGKHGGWMRQ